MAHEYKDPTIIKVRNNMMRIFDTFPKSFPHDVPEEIRPCVILTVVLIKQWGEISHIMAVLSTGDIVDIEESKSLFEEYTELQKILRTRVDGIMEDMKNSSDLQMMILDKTSEVTDAELKYLSDRGITNKHLMEMVPTISKFTGAKMPEIPKDAKNPEAYRDW
jgi:hypothetical protein